MKLYVCYSFQCAMANSDSRASMPSPDSLREALRSAWS